jgi:hypothetical protein
MRARELTTHTIKEAESGVKVTPYVSIKIAPHLKAAPTKKTNSVKASNMHPEFENQKIEFNLFDPQAVINDNQILLHLQVWDDKTFKDQVCPILLPLSQFF